MKKLRWFAVVSACIFAAVSICRAENLPASFDANPLAESCAKALAKDAGILPAEGKREVLKKALAVVLLAGFGRVLPADLSLAEYESLEELFLSGRYDSLVQQRQAEKFPPADGMSFDGAKLNGAGFARIDQLIGSNGKPIALDRRVPTKVIPLEGAMAERMNQTAGEFAAEPESRSVRAGIDRLYGLPVKAGIAADGVFFRSYAGKLDDYYCRLVQENPRPSSEMDFYAIAESLGGRRFHPLVGVGSATSVPAPWFSLSDILSGGALLAVDEYKRSHPKYGPENPFLGFAARVLPFLGGAIGKTKPGEELQVSRDTIRQAIQNPRRFAPVPVKPIFLDPSRFYGALTSHYLFVAKRLSKKELASEIAKIDFSTPLPDLPTAPDANLVFSDPAGWKNEEFFKDVPALVDVDTPKKFDPTGLYTNVTQEENSEAAIPPASLFQSGTSGGNATSLPKKEPDANSKKQPLALEPRNNLPIAISKKAGENSGGQVVEQSIPSSNIQALPEAPPVVAQLPSFSIQELEKPMPLPQPTPKEEPIKIAKVEREIPAVVEPLRLPPEEKKTLPEPVAPSLLLARIESAQPTLVQTPSAIAIPVPSLLGGMEKIPDFSAENLREGNRSPAGLELVGVLKSSDLSEGLLPKNSGDFLLAENLVSPVEALMPMRLETEQVKEAEKPFSIKPEIILTKEVPLVIGAGRVVDKEKPMPFKVDSFLPPQESKIAKLSLASLGGAAPIVPNSLAAPEQENLVASAVSIVPKKLEPKSSVSPFQSLAISPLQTVDQSEVLPLLGGVSRLLSSPKPLSEQALAFSEEPKAKQWSLEGIPPTDLQPSPEPLSEISLAMPEKLLPTIAEKAPRPQVIPPLPKGNYVAVVSPSVRASAAYLGKISANDRLLSENARQLNRANCYLKWLSSALVPVEKELERDGVMESAGGKALSEASEKTEDFLGELLSFRGKLLEDREQLLKERAKFRIEIEGAPMQESLARLEAIVGKVKGI